jgi:hypothetical protein
MSFASNPRLQLRNLLCYRRELGAFAACQLALRRPRQPILHLRMRGLPALFSCRNSVIDLAVLRAVLGRKESFVPVAPTSAIIDGEAHIGCTSVVYASRFPMVRPGATATIRQRLPETRWQWHRQAGYAVIRQRKTAPA